MFATSSVVTGDGTQSCPKRELTGRWSASCRGSRPKRTLQTATQCTSLSSLSTVPAPAIPRPTVPVPAIPRPTIPVPVVPAGSIPALAIPTGAIPASAIPTGAIPTSTVPAPTHLSVAIPVRTDPTPAGPVWAVPHGSSARSCVTSGNNASKWTTLTCTGLECNSRHNPCCAHRAESQGGNLWVRNGEVWEFEVLVNENQVKQIFDARTDMSWYNFSDMACDHLSQPCDRIILGYKFTSDTGGMTELTCEPQWKKAMSQWNLKTWPGCQTYCWPEPVAQGKIGGHHELSHEEMSLWAKHISEGKATKYLLPKTMKFNHPMTKKLKSGPALPEVHIALNITPTPSVGPSSYIIAGQQVVLSSMAPAPGQSPPTDVSSYPVHTVDIPTIPGMQPYPAPAPQPGPSICASRMRIILECCDVSAVPLVANLLTLMDQEHPMPGLNYVDTASEFNDLGIKDVLDILAMPIELLALFGGLGRDQACQLHKYVRYQILIPLGLLEEGALLVKTGGEASVVKVESGSSIVEVKGERSVVKVKCESSIVENQTQIESWFDSVDQGLDEYGWGEEGGWEEEEDWDKRYNWGIGKEEEERVLEWLTGVREAGENGEGESDGSHEV
ncbi:hypothetical protein EI94DRAFT_1703294 [Lactarius quietus]|nr:hypothetical protein EI94DRAFT_1703294 [Lactarius quietus]